MSSVLSVKNLKKMFYDGGNSVNVLDDISFDVEKGDFIAIMGPSGSGKSTLLYNISGLDRASSGNIMLDGRNINELSQVELANMRLNHFGYVFQQAHLIKNLSVKENIILATSVLNARIDKAMEAKAENLMDLAGILELKDRNVRSLSGGQAQRVSICRSLMNDPKLIFADEPTGALNSKASAEIMDLFVKSNEQGSTIILVTHDPMVASKASQVWFLLDGVIYLKEMLGAWDGDNESLANRKNRINEIMLEIEV